MEAFKIDDPRVRHKCIHIFAYLHMSKTGEVNNGLITFYCVLARWWKLKLKASVTLCLHLVTSQQVVPTKINTNPSQMSLSGYAETNASPK